MLSSCFVLTMFAQITTHLAYNMGKKKMTKGNEGEENLGKLIEPKLKQMEQEYGLKVDRKVKILADLTCIKEKGKFRLGMGFAEVDVAIYKQISFDKSNRQLFEYFKFIHDSKKDKEYLNIPFIILELKSGDITSDAIRARSEVARKIKEIFPFCSYIFIGEDTAKKEETLLRQGKGFNNFFIFENKIEERNIDNIVSRFIKPYLDNLQNMKFF